MATVVWSTPLTPNLLMTCASFAGVATGVAHAVPAHTKASGTSLRRAGVEHRARRRRHRCGGAVIRSDSHHDFPRTITCQRHSPQSCGARFAMRPHNRDRRSAVRAIFQRQPVRRDRVAQHRSRHRGRTRHQFVRGLRITVVAGDAARASPSQSPSSLAPTASACRRTPARSPTTVAITVPASSVSRFISKFEPVARKFFTMIAASLRASARYFSSAEN